MLAKPQENWDEVADDAQHHQPKKREVRRDLRKIGHDGAGNRDLRYDGCNKAEILRLKKAHTFEAIPQGNDEDEGRHPR